MKKLLSLVVMCIIALSASAQIVSSSSRSITREVGAYSNYNRIFVSYNSLSVNATGDSESLGGVAAGWLHGWSISNSIPLYIEGGVNAQYNSKSKDGDKVTFVKANVPVNITYRYTFPNSNISVAPYTGIHLSCGIIAQDKDEYYEETYSLYDDEDAKRVTAGAQVGVGFTFNNKFYVGLEYSTDFTKFETDPDWNFSAFSATLGLEF